MTSDNSYLWALKLERNSTLHIHVQHGKSLQRVHCNVEVTDAGEALEYDER